MDLSHYAQFLGHLPLFKGLSPDELAEICRTFRMRAFKQGDVLCQQGEPSDGMFVIERGSATVSIRTAQGDEQVISQLTGPTVVGEMALLDGAPSSHHRQYNRTLLHSVKID